MRMLGDTSRTATNLTVYQLTAGLIMIRSQIDWRRVLPARLVTDGILNFGLNAPAALNVLVPAGKPQLPQGTQSRLCVAAAVI
jgi:hypothetical protein